MPSLYETYSKADKAIWQDDTETELCNLMPHGIIQTINLSPDPKTSVHLNVFVHRGGEEKKPLQQKKVQGLL